MNKFNISERFGRLIVLEYIGKIKGRHMVRCVCDCGKIKTYILSNIKNGHTKSCGCLIKDNKKPRTIKHGQYKTSEFKAWQSMIQRCYNTNSHNFKLYGGRGITVCDKWRDSFESFLQDIGKKPSKKHQLDRINNNANYTPDNCRWSTPQQNSNNRRNTIYVLFNNELVTISDLSKRYNINNNILRSRIKRGWSVKQALTKPHKKRNI